jgi:hypothetical protein
MQKYTCGARQNNEQIRVQMGISPFFRQCKQIQEI